MLAPELFLRELLLLLIEEEEEAEAEAEAAERGRAAYSVTVARGAAVIDAPHDTAAMVQARSPRTLVKPFPRTKKNTLP